MSDLTGKIALVTGGDRGIGAGCSLALAKAGCDVAVNFRSRLAEAEAVVAQIRSMGRQGIAVQADVSQSAQVTPMVQKIERELGSVSILVNNAGIARRQKIEDITEADWDEIINVNLKSAFLVSQAVLPKMREQRWGRIINMSSVAAQLGGIVGPHYASSKAGLHGLTHAYAGLLAQEGITANTISPALIDTEMVRENALARPNVIPVGRFGEVGEIASVVVMLAENGYITGQTINVNGGWYMS